jgi:hypothetical protein
MKRMFFILFSDACFNESLYFLSLLSGLLKYGVGKWCKILDDPAFSTAVYLNPFHNLMN